MSTLKRPLECQDPDYEDTSYPLEKKRLRQLEENAKADLSLKITSIIHREFSKELEKKESEVFEIQERLHNAQKTLHMLRYAIVKNFYNRKHLQVQESLQIQKRIHPAVKKLIGKHPKSTSFWPSSDLKINQQCETVTKCNVKTEQISSICSEHKAEKQKDSVAECSISDTEKLARVNTTGSKILNGETETFSGIGTNIKKIPRYIPPKPGNDHFEFDLGRGFHNKVKKRFVIGNVSKWIPVDTRDDPASHKWMIYVRGPKEAPDVSSFVSKVRFFLHPSYRPHDVVEVSTHPFHLSRRGWGEFPIRVQIHFIHALNKPVDVIHHLKLDRSYTGLQMLGAETIVDIWLYSGTVINKGDTGFESDDETLEANTGSLKTENDEKYSNISNNGGSSNNELLGNNFVSEIKQECDDNSRTENYNCVALDNCERLSSPVLFTDHDYVKDPSNSTSLCTESDDQSNSNTVPSSSTNSVDPISMSCSKQSIKVRNFSELTTSNKSEILKNGLKEIEDSTLNIKLQASCNEKSEVLSKPDIAKKPTTLLKCIDSNGKVFYIKTGGLNLKNESVVPTALLKSRVNLNSVKTETGNVDSKIPTDNSDSHSLVTVSNTKCSTSNKQDSDNVNIDSKLVMKPLLCNSGSTPSDNSQQTSNINTIKLSTSKVGKVVRLPASALPILTLPERPLKKGNENNLLSSLVTKTQDLKTDTLNNIVLVLKDGKYYPVQQQKSSNIELPAVAKSNSTTNVTMLNPTNVCNANNVAKVSMLDNVLACNSYSILKSAPQQAPVKIINSAGSVVRNINLQSQSVSLLNCSRPGLNVMKPGHSLLRKNLETAKHNSFVSKLVPVIKSQFDMEQTVCDDPVELSVFPKKKKSILNTCPVTTPKHFIHQERLRYAIEACKFTEQSKCLRWFLRHLPLICDKVSDPDYKEVHPYTAPSYEVYFSWNIGKQRACEWLRAKAVQNMLLKVGFTEHNVWSTLSILKYARQHGYTPVIPGADAYPEPSNRNVPTEPKSTYSEPVRIMDWLESSNYLCSNRNDDDIDIEVDVVNLDTSKSTMIKEEKTEQENKKLEVMKIDTDLESSCEFVHETARKIGIHLKAEEIVPGILYSATERLLFEAVKSLVDDVLRRALSCAYRRNSFSLPDVITPYDIQDALCERPEFDILTNSGLGVQSADIG